MNTCSINDQPLWDPNATSACDGGTAYTCFNMAPWSVSDKLSYGFAAVPAQGDVCGRCYQLNFSGGGQHDSNPGAQALSDEGKVMIVQAINIGWDVNSTQFDLLIPGGGVGAFDACSTQWGTSDLGAQYGGFLTECQSVSSDWNVVKTCVYNKCEQVFGDKSELMDGCDWFVNWFEAANNPKLLYKEVTCPAALGNVSGMN
jgi:hypothetical protein